jgi:hypothetical protein
VDAHRRREIVSLNGIDQPDDILAPPMIDPVTGVIEFEQGRLQQTRTAFLASPLGAGCPDQEPLRDYVTYSIQARIDGNDVSASLFFANGRLANVQLMFTAFGEAWGEKEFERRDAHTAWLRSCLGDAGPPWRFSWGSVESEYVQKDALSQVYIAYLPSG